MAATVFIAPVAAAQLRDPPVISESFQIRMASAGLGAGVGVRVAARLPYRGDPLAYFSGMLIGGFSGAVLGAALPKLESHCGTARRIVRSAVGGTFGLIPGTLLFLTSANQRNVSAGATSVVIAALGMAMGAAGSAELSCPRRATPAPPPSRGELGLDERNDPSG